MSPQISLAFCFINQLDPIALPFFDPACYYHTSDSLSKNSKKFILLCRGSLGDVANLLLNSVNSVNSLQENFECFKWVVEQANK